MGDELGNCRGGGFQGDYGKHERDIALAAVLDFVGLTDAQLRENFFQLAMWSEMSMEEWLQEMGVTSCSLPQPYIFHEDLFTDMDALSLLQQQYWRGIVCLPALRFYSQWVRRGREEDGLSECLLAILLGWKAWGRDFLEGFFYHFHILSAGMRMQIQQEPASCWLERDMLADIAEHKAAGGRFHYPAVADTYEGVVDGYEFRLLRSSEEYLEHIFRCRSLVNREVSVPEETGALHFGIFQEGKLTACLELHSVFEIFYVMINSEKSQSRALIRIAVLHFLQRHGLVDLYGPYLPGDYVYLAEEGRDDHDGE